MTLEFIALFMKADFATLKFIIIGERLNDRFFLFSDLTLSEEIKFIVIESMI